MIRQLSMVCLVLSLGSVELVAADGPETEIGTGEVTLTFGIVPQQPAMTLFRTWSPLLSAMSRETGFRFVFATAPDIPAFEDRLAEQKYDFAYMNPYHFTVFNDGGRGYKAVARAKDKLIQGVIVVRNDSPITDLSQLANKKIAFPAPAAFAASVIPNAILVERGIPFEPHYVSSHESVYQSVASGFFSAGGGVHRTLAATDPDVRKKLRIIWTTKGFTPHAIAARPGIDSEIFARVQRALLNVANQDDGKTALEKLKLKGFVEARDSDWDDVRALPIELKLGRQKEVTE